jgi:hypothetical protein
MMALKRGIGLWAAGALMALSACSNGGEPRLMNVRSASNGPDEFSIVPPKPLQLPTDLAALPTPTPGGSNLTDATPNEDAIIALGGNPNAGPGDVGLLAYASRYGVTSNIRGLLATEDLAFRTDNQGRILERLFNVNVYFKAYAKESLDQHAELERWRAVGVGNPSAPPPKEGE